MSGRVDPSHRGAAPRKWLPEIDRAWLARVALALVVAAGLVLFARVATLAFSAGGKRLERQERTALPPRETPAVPSHAGD